SKAVLRVTRDAGGAVASLRRCWSGRAEPPVGLRVTNQQTRKARHLSLRNAIAPQEGFLRLELDRLPGRAAKPEERRGRGASAVRRGRDRADLCRTARRLSSPPPRGRPTSR